MAKTKYVTIELTETELRSIAFHLNSFPFTPGDLRGIIASAFERAKTKIVQADVDQRTVQKKN